MRIDTKAELELNFCSGKYEKLPRYLLIFLTVVFIFKVSHSQTNKINLDSTIQVIRLDSNRTIDLLLKFERALSLHRNKINKENTFHSPFDDAHDFSEILNRESPDLLLNISKHKNQLLEILVNYKVSKSEKFFKRDIV